MLAAKTIVSTTQRPRLSSKPLLATQPAFRASHIARADHNEHKAAQTEQPVQPAASGEVQVEKVEANAPILKEGQGTAVVTGAISAVLGIGYLALVWLMDSRGGQMMPPPPEAFLP